MSLNFSIESILRHGNVEPDSGTLPLMSSGLNETNFLDESTSAFLKKQHLNYLSNQTNGTSSTNGLNNHQLSETINSNLLQSQLFYLNNLSKQNLIDGLQLTNGSTTTTGPSTFSSPLELNHLNSLQLQNHLAQLTQFNRYHYLSKLNSIYNTNDLNSSTAFKNLNQQHPKLVENGNKSSINLIGVSSNESQCSPLSHKSSEMMLNYDDSSESQHSGNNVSINSNNSANNSSKSINQLNLNNSNSNKKDPKEPPLCQKCKLHGMRNMVKGHKKSCIWKDCPCKLCILTDIGKRLRGKKVKKATAGLAAANAVSNNQQPIISTATTIHQTKTPTIASISTNQLLMNIDNLNNNSNLNDNNILLSSLQSTTPNSNSNSSCSNVSISTNPTLVSLYQQQQHLKTTATITNNNLYPNLDSLKNEQLNFLEKTATITNNNLYPNLDSLKNEQLNFLEKTAKKDYMKIVINILKDKLAQDGLNFKDEIKNLNIAVIYLLLNKFGDKNELYSKFLADA